MEDFLRKIKLIDVFSTKLNITRPEFVSALRENVEESDINNVFSGLFEVFSSNKKNYKGLVDSRGFHIRKKKKLFKKKHGFINAKGTFKTNGETLIINTKISAFSLKRVLFMSFLTVCYFTFIFYQFDNVSSFQEMYKNVSPFFIVFILVIPLVSYFSLKKEVVKMKKDLEAYFYSISSKVNH